MLGFSKIFTFFFFTIFIFSCTEKEKKDISFNAKLSVKVTTVDVIIIREGYAPNFTWINSYGESIDFDSYRGKITLVNFWATWCAPCKKELPDLVSISKEMESQGVKIIGISTDRGSNVINEVNDFIKENKITYTNVLDNGKLAEAFGNIRGLPTTFLVDIDGKILETFLGIRSKEFFVERVNNYLK